VLLGAILLNLSLIIVLSPFSNSVPLHDHFRMSGNNTQLWILFPPSRDPFPTTTAQHKFLFTTGNMCGWSYAPSTNAHGHSRCASFSTVYFGAYCIKASSTHSYHCAPCLTLGGGSLFPWWQPVLGILCGLVPTVLRMTQPRNRSQQLQC
jgi:hypothetical protein